MANKINAKLILELKASGLSRNQIATTRHMSKHSVSDVINIAREKDITYEKVNYLSEDKVCRMIFPDKFTVENLCEQPDHEYVHQELKRVGVTPKLLWQEYQDKCKTSGLISMEYTKFCNGYADCTIVNKLTNHLENKPGVKAEADWSGPDTLAWSFDDRIQRFVDYVYQEKYNSRIQRMIKSAKLRFPQVDMYGIYYDGWGLNKSLLKDLFRCQYIDCHQSIVFQDPIGSGKTYLACALAK